MIHLRLLFASARILRATEGQASKEAPAARKPTRNFEMPVISFVPVQTGDGEQRTAEIRQRMLYHEILFEW